MISVRTENNNVEVLDINNTDNNNALIETVEPIEGNSIPTPQPEQIQVQVEANNNVVASPTKETPPKEEIPKQKGKQSKVKKILKRIMYMFIKIIIVAIILFLLFTFVFGFHTQKGLSMYPKFVDSDLLLYYRLEKNFHTGDVVIARVGNKDYALRIVAITNDIVDMDEDGNLIVNSHEVTEDIFYVTKKKKDISYPYIVGKDEFFLLGDYRTHSKDSRNFGSIKMENIKGKVINVLRTRDI